MKSKYSENRNKAQTKQKINFLLCYTLYSTINSTPTFAIMESGESCGKY